MLLLILAVLAQIPAQTAVDYARAERFMGYNTNPLVQSCAPAYTRPGYRMTRSGTGPRPITASKWF